MEQQGKSNLFHPSTVDLVPFWLILNLVSFVGIFVLLKPTTPPDSKPGILVFVFVVLTITTLILFYYKKNIYLEVKENQIIWKGLLSPQKTVDFSSIAKICSINSLATALLTGSQAGHFFGYLAKNGQEVGFPDFFGEKQEKTIVNLVGSLGVLTEIKEPNTLQVIFVILAILLSIVGLVILIH